MRIRDKIRQTVFITEDPNIIRQATLGKNYEIVAEETAIDARRKALDGLKKEEVVAEAGKFNILPDAFKTKTDFIEAILEAEATAATTGNAA